MNKTTVRFLFAILILAVGGYFYYQSMVPEGASTPIMSFDDCAAAGYPVMESYPRQCNTPSGQHFVEKVTVPPAPVSDGKCYVGGCSGEICSDQEDMASNCIYKPEFSCYRKATCERQSNGQCGWTQTSALSACITDARANINVNN